MDHDPRPGSDDWGPALRAALVFGAFVVAGLVLGSVTGSAAVAMAPLVPGAFVAYWWANRFERRTGRRSAGVAERHMRALLIVMALGWCVGTLVESAPWYAKVLAGVGLSAFVVAGSRHLRTWLRRRASTQGGVRAH